MYSSRWRGVCAASLNLATLTTEAGWRSKSSNVASKVPKNVATRVLVNVIWKCQVLAELVRMLVKEEHLENYLRFALHARAARVHRFVAGGTTPYCVLRLLHHVWHMCKLLGEVWYVV